MVTGQPTPGTPDTDVDRLAVLADEFQARAIAAGQEYAGYHEASADRDARERTWAQAADDLRAVLAAAQPSVMSSALDGGLVLTARCENVSEPDGIPCTGALRYHWGQPEAACDTCGGRCGIAVAAWTSVAAARPSAAAAPEELREAVVEALKAYDRGHLGRWETADAVLAVTQAAQDAAVAAARRDARSAAPPAVAQDDAEVERLFQVGYDAVDQDAMVEARPGGFRVHLDRIVRAVVRAVLAELRRTGHLPTPTTNGDYRTDGS